MDANSIPSIISISAQLPMLCAILAAIAGCWIIKDRLPQSVTRTGFTRFIGCMSKSSSAKDIELHPDAWERFERAAGAVAKAPPQHRVAKKSKAKKRAKSKAKSK